MALPHQRAPEETSAIPSASLPGLPVKWYLELHPNSYNNQQHESIRVLSTWLSSTVADANSLLSFSSSVRRSWGVGCFKIEAHSWYGGSPCFWSLFEQAPKGALKKSTRQAVHRQSFARNLSGTDRLRRSEQLIRLLSTCESEHKLC